MSLISTKKIVDDDELTTVNYLKYLQQQLSEAYSELCQISNTAQKMKFCAV